MGATGYCISLWSTSWCIQGNVHPFWQLMTTWIRMDFGFPGLLYKCDPPRRCSDRSNKVVKSHYYRTRFPLACGAKWNALEHALHRRGVGNSAIPPYCGHDLAPMLLPQDGRQATWCGKMQECLSGLLFGWWGCQQHPEISWQIHKKNKTM